MPCAHAGLMPAKARSPFVFWGAPAARGAPGACVSSASREFLFALPCDGRLQKSGRVTASRPL